MIAPSASKESTRLFLSLPAFSVLEVESKAELRRFSEDSEVGWLLPLRTFMSCRFSIEFLTVRVNRRRKARLTTDVCHTILVKVNPSLSISLLDCHKRPHKND